MFEFTREFIINDDKGHLANNKKWEVRKDTFLVERMVNIRKKDIVSVHRTKGKDSEKEVVKVDFTKVKGTFAAGDLIRMIITIRQEGRVISLVNDQYPWPSKQYFYEFKASAANALAAADVLAVEAIAKHNAALEDMDRLLDVKKGAEDSELEISARDCYTRIHDIVFVKVPEDADKSTAAAYTGYQDYVELAHYERKNVKEVGTPVGAFTLSKAGSEGRGTTAQLLKNNRLLTAANLDPYGLNKDERPIPGAIYDQFVIEQVSERRHIGSHVFGAIDHSLTTYVFFVNSTYAGDFNTVLTSLGVAICESAPDAPIAKDSHVHDVIAKAVDVKANAAADAAASAADIKAVNDVIDAVQAAHASDDNATAIQGLKKR